MTGSWETLSRSLCRRKSRSSPGSLADRSLHWVQDGELGEATSGDHRNDPFLSSFLFLKHPFGSACFSRTTLPDLPCSASRVTGSRLPVRPSRTSVTHWGPSRLRLLEFFIVSMAKRNVSLLVLYLLYSLTPRLNVTIGFGTCGSRPRLTVERDDFLPFWVPYYSNESCQLISHVNERVWGQKCANENVSSFKITSA